MNQFGHFCENGYKITERNLPRPQNNYLCNDEYVAAYSQVGDGYGFAKDEVGRKLNIVVDRAVYISDGERCWQAGGLPVQRNLQHYECVHGINFTDITVSHRGIRTKCRYFVPKQGKREFLRCCIKNETRQAKNLKVIPYYATGFNQYEQGGHGDFCEESNCVIVSAYATFDSQQATKHYAYLSAVDTATGYDARHNAFIGPYGHKLQPAAIAEQMGCTNSNCINDKICLALENSITLAPGEHKVFYYAIGAENSADQIPAFSAEEIEQAFEAVCDTMADDGSLRFHTPWDDLDALSNVWLKQQVRLGSRWGAVTHCTLRDLAIHIEALSCFAPKLAAERMCQLLTHQFESGLFPHTIHKESEDLLPCAESTLRPIITAYAITKELGDVDFLLRKIPFNNGTNATVYDHLKQALSYLWKTTGHMGLIKTRFDCNAEQNDKYVSIHLSAAYVQAAEMFSEMANWIGSAADSRTGAHYAQEMKKRVNAYAWSESRYIYAIADNKHLIGAKSCPEGSLFALPQIYSVLSDFDVERSAAAMDSLEIELNTDAGLLYCAPPFSETKAHIDGIDKVQAGSKENGGIDLLTSVLKLAADSKLQRNDKIDEGLRKLLPEHHEFSPTYGEPYKLASFYYAEQAGYRAGQADDLPCSAAGGALLYVMTRYLYGIRPEFGGLLIRPCLPVSWKECSLTKWFGGCRYNIHYIQKDKGICNTIDGIFVNGKEVNPQLPIRPQPGKTLNIEVILRT